MGLVFLCNVYKTKVRPFLYWTRKVERSSTKLTASTCRELQNQSFTTTLQVSRIQYFILALLRGLEKYCEQAIVANERKFDNREHGEGNNNEVSFHAIDTVILELICTTKVRSGQLTFAVRGGYRTGRNTVKFWVSLSKIVLCGERVSENGREHWTEPGTDLSADFLAWTGEGVPNHSRKSFDHVVASKKRKSNYSRQDQIW